MALQAAHRAARGVGIPAVCVQMLPATLAGPIMRNRTAVSCIHRGARRRAYSSVVPGAFPNLRRLHTSQILLMIFFGAVL